MFRWLSIFLVVMTPVSIALWWWSKTSEYERQYDALIRPCAEEQKIDPLLVRAVIWRESRFKPRMRGMDGERGLMQIMEVVVQDWMVKEKVKEFNYEELLEPATNIQVGTWYLGRAIRRWPATDDPLVFGLAEYNAGRSNALRWVDPDAPQSSEAFMKRIDFPTTKRYIQVILAKYKQYQGGYIQPPWVNYWNDWKPKVERKLGLDKEITK